MTSPWDLEIEWYDSLNYLNTTQNGHQNFLSYLKYHLFYDEFDFDSGDTKLRIVRICNERSRETNRDQPHIGYGRGKIYLN